MSILGSLQYLLSVTLKKNSTCMENIQSIHKIYSSFTLNYLAISICGKIRAVNRVMSNIVTKSSSYGRRKELPCDILKHNARNYNQFNGNKIFNLFTGSNGPTNSLKLSTSEAMLTATIGPELKCFT